MPIYTDEFAQLSVTNVKLWWPNGMGNTNCIH